jgi:hypothetical protein
VAVLQEHDVAGVVEQGGDVRGDIALATFGPDHQRRSVAGDYDGLGIVVRDHDDRVATLDLGERPRDRDVEIGAGLDLSMDEVSDDLAVSVRGEPVTGSAKLGLEGAVVLDDAVVDDADR